MQKEKITVYYCKANKSILNFLIQLFIHLSNSRQKDKKRCLVTYFIIILFISNSSKRIQYFN